MNIKELTTLIGPGPKYRQVMSGVRSISKYYCVDLYEDGDEYNSYSDCSITLSASIVESMDKREIIRAFCHELGHHIQFLGNGETDLREERILWNILTYERQASMLGYILYKTHFIDAVALTLKDFDMYLNGEDLLFTAIDSYEFKNRFVESYADLLYLY